MGLGIVGIDFLIVTRVGQYGVFDLVYPAHPRAQSVGDTKLVELMPIAGTDHSAVGKQAKLPDTESLANAIGHRNQRGHIRRIARPHLTTDGVAMIVKHYADYHLIEIGAPIFGMTFLPQSVTTVAFKIERRGVKEHKIKPAKQITALAKQLLFDVIFKAAWCQRL